MIYMLIVIAGDSGIQVCGVFGQEPIDVMSEVKNKDEKAEFTGKLKGKYGQKVEGNERIVTNTVLLKETYLGLGLHQTEFKIYSD